jgi:hypothetical protein
VGSLDFTTRPGEATGEDFVMDAAYGAAEGWFPLGEISIIAGSSGTGKTTFGLQLLEAQSRGGEYLGHRTFGLPYVIIMEDRSPLSLKRTFKRLGMLDQMENLRECSDSKKGPAVCVEEIYRSEIDKPRVVFIEGLDLWTPDQSSMDAVTPVLKALRQVATRLNIAVVATLGSPKMKKREGYASPRDCIFGSSCWSRMVETVIHMTEDYDTGMRQAIALPRNAGKEAFSLKFQNGRLEWYVPSIEERQAEDPRSAFNLWAEGQERLTWAAAREAFPSLPRSTFFDWKAKRVQ